jgi:SIR2-like domain
MASIRGHGMTAGKTGNGNTSASRHLYSIEYDADDGTLTPLQGQPIIDLYRSLAIGGIVAFVGSGTSYLLGYESWDAFAENLVKAAGNTLRPSASGERLDRLTVALDNVIQNKAPKGGAGKLDKFDRLALATEALRRVADRDLQDKHNKLLADWFDFKRPWGMAEAKSVLRSLKRDARYVGFAKALELELDQSAFLPIDFSPGIALAKELCAPGKRQTPPKRGRDPLSKMKLLDSPAPSIDVLGTLRRDWKVSRYATLNYDHEIERMLERADFPFHTITPKPDGPDAIGESPAGRELPYLSGRSRLGEKARSVDLNRMNVAEFMLFAADSPAGVSQVLHLHGSRQDPAQMIVTDIDYNRRYFASAAWAELLESGQELLYRGNAIVFVGVGMNEDVLFRAMRILSQAPDREVRPVYAFMPSNGETKDTADAIKLFQRYGIRTIFYGTRLGLGLDPEAGALDQHPLVQDAIKAGRGENAAEVAERLNRLSVEVDFLARIRTALDDLLKTEKQSKIAGRLDFAKLCKELKSIVGMPARSLFDPLSQNFNIDYLPRLLLTPWHRSVFGMIWTNLSARNTAARKVMGCKSGVEALRAAVISLESAVHSRALQDALLVISATSMNWRKRWQERPAFPVGANSRGKTVRPHFRTPPAIPNDVRICSHNISKPHDPAEINRKMLGRILFDESGKRTYLATVKSMGGKKLQIARARNGSGKGMLASLFAAERKLDGETVRIVVSLGQSCGRDPVFDLIAHHVRQKESGCYKGPLEIVISKTDILLTTSEERPRLAEWDALFRRILRSPTDIRMLILCEYGESANYFERMVRSDDRSSIWKEGVGKIFNSVPVATSGGPGWHAHEVSRIARVCKSVWVASFLTAAHAEIVVASNDALDLRARKTVFDEMLRRVDHAINITQDPRQRVPMVIDVAISHIEQYILCHRKVENRVTKVISHAILKHLFAFGGPVEESVFRHCWEIVKIRSDYKGKIKNLDREISKAIDWLRRLDLVTLLTDCYSGTVRYGLHSHVRNWLGTKKGLPFSVVMGREQTAITVVPIIDEEIVPLDREDYTFIWKTIDGLLISHEDGSLPPQQQIRAAFMLLRGSMRIGTVLRSAHGHGPSSHLSRTPLEEYLRRLLDIRHAALRCADSGVDRVPPLFEREWVWLFNEMGVVKLLQGHAHDATALFEQAIEFETDRLKRKEGFEALIYESQKLPEFSITKLRIMTNLAATEIERGAFNRASRIMSSEKRDLDDLEALFLSHPPERMAQPEDSTMLEETDARRMHREIRILRLVLGLVDARLKFLCGGAGETIHWLVSHREAIVREGVHGLTALYFLILADIEMGQKDQKKAAAHFATARAEAEASGRSDLIFSVMLGETESQMSGRRRQDATHIQHQLGKIRKIKHEANRMGMTRVEVTASMLRARLYLGFDEYRSAKQDLMNALTLSTANGLNTKRVSALIDMAALVASLDPELRTEAKDMAEAARFDAERMGYKLAAARAKDLELVLRERGSIEDWVFRRGFEAQDTAAADD